MHQVPHLFFLFLTGMFLSDFMNCSSLCSTMTKRMARSRKKEKEETHQETESLLGIRRSLFPEENAGEEGRIPSFRWLFMRAMEKQGQ